MTARILVVDDETTTTTCLSVLLGARGHFVEIAGDGHAARRALAAQRPDLAIIDVGLPDADGFVICEALRRDAATRDLPIVVTSARARPTEREKSLAVGADAFLAKPFAAAELLRTVEALLEARRQP